IPGTLAGPCFIGFAIGESLGAAALRIAGGIFTKIADIGSDLMKIVFNIKEDDARNPGVIADCTGDNAGDSVGPSADGFETYGVTGVALISFILLGVHDPLVKVQLLVWIFAMRVMMIVASGLSYFLNAAFTKARYQTADHMNFEAPLTTLVWLTSFVSVALTFLASRLLIPSIGGDATLWWKLSLVITCGTLAGAIIPELVKVFTSVHSAHVREIVTSPRKAGAHRYRGGRCDDDDLLDHRGADARLAARAVVEPVDSPSPVPARPDHRRRGDLLVHGRFDAGRDDRRLPRGRVHQGEHPARGDDQGFGLGQQEGGGDLHAIRAEGDVQHLPVGLLCDAR